jgi:hypothetical protein
MSEFGSRISEHLLFHIYYFIFIMKNVPAHYFEELEEKICFQIELERLSPNLSEAHNNITLNFSTKNDLPANYFAGLETAVFAQISAVENPQNKQQLTAKKTKKTVWWSLASSISAAAIVVGVLFIQPNINDLAQAENTNTTPISATTAALFAQLNKQEAMSFLQENATNIEENILAQHTQHLDFNDFSTLKNDEISDFIQDNNIILEE